jgi:predicted metalloprotease with PDZ domain
LYASRDSHGRWDRADESDKANYTIGRVRADSPAAEAGLEVGDKLMFWWTESHADQLSELLGRYNPAIAWL